MTRNLGDNVDRHPVFAKIRYDIRKSVRKAGPQYSDSGAERHGACPPRRSWPPDQGHRDGSAPRIPALRIAEKRPVKHRLVDVFAAVQAEDRNGTPGQKGRRGEYGDVAVERGRIELLLAESPAGLQSGIRSLQGIYSGRRLWRQRI